MNALEKLRSLVDQIRSQDRPFDVLEHWRLAGRLLSRFPVDADEAARVCRDCDIEGLDALVTGLEKPSPTHQHGEPDPPVSEAEMAAALKAFRKRLKLARLADESRLGGRYTSSGRHSDIDAIIPPGQFGAHVWRALEKAGKLKHTGQGFYAER